MSRIDPIFKACKAENRNALITFITACDPNYETSLAAMKALANNGADIIELGMPFTDPVADGPTIQEASNRALAAGGCMKKTFEMVKAFREENTQTAIVLMGYYNPVMAYGTDKFLNECKNFGVDGLIIVDLPPEEDQDLRKSASGHDIDLIRLLTPTSDEKRLPTLLKDATGFLYYVSITGVTGAKSANIDEIGPHIQEIKKHTDLPVAIGFGIKTPENAKNMAKLADGVVVGSAIINLLLENANDAPESKIGAFVKSLSSALKN